MNPAIIKSIFKAIQQIAKSPAAKTALKTSQKILTSEPAKQIYIQAATSIAVVGTEKFVAIIKAKGVSKEKKIAEMKAINIPLEQKLAELKSVYDKGLINDQEYSEGKSIILNAHCGS